MKTMKYAFLTMFGLGFWMSGITAGLAENAVPAGPTMHAGDTLANLISCRLMGLVDQGCRVIV